MKTLTYIGIALEVLTAIIAISQYHKFRNSYLKFIVFLFVLIALTEVILTGYRLFFDASSNLVIYNILQVVTFFILFFIYTKRIDSGVITTITKAILIMYVALICYESLVLNVDYLTKTQTIPYIFAGFGILCYIVVFFYKMLKSDTIIYFNKDLLFWISFGLFIYYVAFIPFKVSQNLFFEKDAVVKVYFIRIIVTILVNIIYMIGFLWSGKVKQA